MTTVPLPLHGCSAFRWVDPESFSLHHPRASTDRKASLGAGSALAPIARERRASPGVARTPARILSGSPDQPPEKIEPRKKYAPRKISALRKFSACPKLQALFSAPTP